MPFTQEEKNRVVKEFAKFEGDTGSTEVQIAILTYRINNLSTHLTENQKDKHGQRGLQVLVGQRNRLTRYLRTKDYDSYRALIERLGLRR
jgi:small subunit ribosomal protein S15